MANSSSSGSAKKSTGNSSILVGVVLALIVFALFFVFLIGIQRKAEVMVANKDVPPYTVLSDKDFKKLSVPKDSVKPNDVTPDEFNAFVKQSALLVTTVKENQRLDDRSVTTTAYGTLSVVQEGERVIGLSTTIPGGVGGAIQPGSVVDVYSADSGSSDEGAAAAVATDVKVIGVGSNSGEQIVQNTDSSSSTKTDKEAQQQQSAGIIVLLVVKEDEAGIAGLAARFAIDSRKCFDSVGTVKDLIKGVCPDKARSVVGSTTSTGATDETIGSTSDTSSTGSTGASDNSFGDN